MLGTGTVGRAVLQRLQDWRDTCFGGGLDLVHVANSRQAWHATPTGGLDASGLSPADVRRSASGQPPDAAANAWSLGDEGERCIRRAGNTRSPCADAISTDTVGAPGSNVPNGPVLPTPLAAGTGLDSAIHALGPHGLRILIDATPSEQVAAQHAYWLERGIHVVTACKLARGTALEQWQAIEHAKTLGHTHYGDAATVGAGLPLLRSIRELRDGGDRIHSIAGVLSGSLAWLFHHYDGMRPFSALVRQAREAGYTEPDPREDLSGEDVRRKLLILARAAGVALDAADVRVDSLVPSALSILPTNEVDSGLDLLDAPLRARYAQAWKNNEVLRFVARLEDGRARVGLESLPSSHPLAGGAGTDNRVAIHSDRYPEQPLLIQGPGAGAEVTAAALLDDVLRIVRSI